MNNYETIVIVNPTLDEKSIKYGIEEMKELINKNGKVTNVEEWGKKKLAYPMRNHFEGYYILIDFTSDQKFTDELERYFATTDEIIKYIIVRKD